MDEEKIIKILEENLELSRQICKDLHKIRYHFVWQSVNRLLMILIFIVIPSVLAYIYLPPLLKDLIGQYGQIMNSFNGPGGIK